MLLSLLCTFNRLSGEVPYALYFVDEVSGILGFIGNNFWYIRDLVKDYSWFKSFFGKEGRLACTILREGSSNKVNN